jgi:hypothetical protein
MPESQTVSSGERTDTQPTAAEHVAPERSVQGPAAQFPGTVRGRPAIDVRQLRHPSEPSRFALAASASILLGGLGLLVALRLAGVFEIVLITATLALALGSVWWLVQVHRAKLLGGAARVTPQTFPVLSAAADEVKRQLDYTQPVEIFVLAQMDESVLLTSFFGTHVLVMEGALVAELVKPENRPQLDFILATFFGKLKIKTLAWAPAHIAINALKLPHFLNFLFAPWERATVYTGDQVAATCCGSLDESIIALNRLLVGKDLAQDVGISGLMSQAALVRRAWLPRLQQLYSLYPHLTNRYLNLLSFADHSAPEEARTFRDRIDPVTDARVRDVSARLAQQRERGPRGGLVAVSIAASIAVVSLTGFAMFSTIPQQALAGFSGKAAASTPSDPPPTPSSSPSSSPRATSDPAAALASHAPAAFASTCSALTPQPAITGLVAAITCTPAEAGGPRTVQYYQFANTADMNASFENAANGLPDNGACDQGGQRGAYHFTTGPGPGLWACSYNSSNEGQMIWTSTRLNILTVSTDPVQTPQQLHDWFYSPAATGPD